MKVLVLNGSPKQKSDTMVLTDAFLDGIRQTGDHDIEVVDLIKKDIKPCVGCFMCWKKQDGRCVIDDYQNVLLQKMLEADTVIWSFPLYCCGMPSHVKAVMDRMIPFSKMKVEDGNDAIATKNTGNTKNKRYVVICGSGFPLKSANFEAVKLQCMHMFGRVRIICVNETPLLHAAGAEQYTKPLIQKFVAAGKEFGERTYLYRETVEGLQEPMMPGDEYLKFATGIAQKLGIA